MREQKTTTTTAIKQATNRSIDDSDTTKDVGAMGRRQQSHCILNGKK